MGPLKPGGRLSLIQGREGGKRGDRESRSFFRGYFLHKRDVKPLVCTHCPIGKTGKKKDKVLHTAQEPVAAFAAGLLRYALRPLDRFRLKEPSRLVAAETAGIPLWFFNLIKNNSPLDFLLASIGYL